MGVPYIPNEKDLLDEKILIEDAEEETDLCAGCIFALDYECGYGREYGSGGSCYE